MRRDEQRKQPESLWHMWRSRVRFMLVVVGCCVTGAAIAQERIELACNFEERMDQAGNRTPVSGVSMSLIVTATAPGKVKIQSTSPCGEFLGTTDDLKISGTCEAVLQLGTPFRMRYNLTVDRLTGAFSQIEHYNNDELTFFSGRCTRAKRVF